MRREGSIFSPFSCPQSAGSASRARDRRARASARRAGRFAHAHCELTLTPLPFSVALIPCLPSSSRGLPTYLTTRLVSESYQDI